MICYSIIIMDWRFVIDIYKQIDDCIEQIRLQSCGIGYIHDFVGAKSHNTSTVHYL